ncbi:hypothetical protein [Actinomycetospora atypica]|uniref:Uncharacterized protein n=1 Tax=Actinomycetospora atypica TaxID=1290095 RepID=A0ABV9YGR2_9PSEU
MSNEPRPLGRPEKTVLLGTAGLILAACAVVTFGHQAGPPP